LERFIIDKQRDGDGEYEYANSQKEKDGPDQFRLIQQVELAQHIIPVVLSSDQMKFACPPIRCINTDIYQVLSQLENENLQTCTIACPEKV